MIHVLFNPHAGNGTGEAAAKTLNAFYPETELVFHDMTALSSYEAFFETLLPEDRLIIAGGDGTLNRFINDCPRLPDRDIYYYAAGSGNDFLTDRGGKKGDAPIRINECLSSLPVVTVKGKRYRFLNGVGYGLDGYCCEEGDRQRGKSDKPVNYALIAITGLLGKFRRTNATVTCDNVTRQFRNVLLSPTMNGRYYGGGMMVAPDQDRLNADRTVTLIVMHSKSRLKALLAFPSIFKGEHIARTDLVSVFTGHDVTVSFDRPTALQIDGETVSEVLSYTVKSEKAPSGAKNDTVGQNA